MLPGRRHGLRQGGQYPQDVTIHSKEKITFVGWRGSGHDSGAYIVWVLSMWASAYGRRHEISDMHINDQGGMPSVFQWEGIVLRRVKINACCSAASPRCADRRIVVIGGSERPRSVCRFRSRPHREFYHDNDHGVSIAGKSNVRLERNVITRSLFEPSCQRSCPSRLVSNTWLIMWWRGVSRAIPDDVTARVRLNRVGFVIAPSSQTTPLSMLLQQG